jgi:hypothetical protein
MPAVPAKLPPAALEHMSNAARNNIPAPLQVQVADPGVYLAEGLYGAGPGWYHLGTPDAQLYLGHPNEADYFVFDFDVTAQGGFTSQGMDVTTHFDRGLDGIVALDSFAIIGQGESYGIVAGAGHAVGKLDDRIEYTLTRLRFDGPVAVETEIASVGAFGIVELG